MVKQTHTVATDALATLGTIIDETAGRDAIHLAVEPAVAVEKLYTSWLEGEALTAEELQRLRAATERLKQLYEGHIHIEENLVFPRASAGLDSQTIAKIGEEFRARRK